MIVVAVVSMRGGTGKTTLCLNVGAQLAERGQKVAIVDLDFQGSWLYELIDRSTREIQTSDEFIEFQLNDDLPEIHAEKILQHRGIDLFPVTRDEDTRLGRYRMEKVAQPRDFVRLIYRPLSALQREGYDIVLLDCPPGLKWFADSAMRVVHEKQWKGKIILCDRGDRIHEIEYLGFEPENGPFKNNPTVPYAVVHLKAPEYDEEQKLTQIRKTLDVTTFIASNPDLTAQEDESRMRLIVNWVRK